MKDKTGQPRPIPYSVDQLEAVLAAALEHSAHGWAALELETKVNRLNPLSWPPQVEAEVRSAQYHFSVLITLVFEAYSAIRGEKDHIEEVMSLVNKSLGGSPHGEDSSG